MVLLKNAASPGGAPVLPLKQGGKLAVIGALAQTPKYQGGGSSHIIPTRMDSVIAELSRLGGEVDVQYAPGYALDSDEIDQRLIQAAVATAQQADQVVIVAGMPDAYESEGFDRTHLRMPENQVKLIEAVAAVNPRLAVVLMCGAPVVMPWLERVPALLCAYMGGQAVGGAIADLLYGAANPSGKLAETWPMALEHNPSYLNFPGDDTRVVYAEGVFVGYRYYDKKRIAPLFPFGHGLSYTRFELSDLRLDKTDLQDGDSLSAQVTVKNVGTVAGQEIVQLYVRDVASTVMRPEKELKGFAKVALAPGEAQTMTIALDRRAFAYWNTDLHDWHIESGEFEILVGSSSVDLPLKASVTVTSTMTLRKPFTRYSTLGELMTHPFGAQVAAMMIQGMVGSAPDVLGMDMQEVFKSIMLRSMVLFSGGQFSEEMMEGLLAQLNASPN
jgi:beta-glucosidase